MKRDMDLCRKIMLVIEEQYVDTAIFNLAVDGYSLEQVAYHCKILCEAGIVTEYNSTYGDNRLQFFSVGSLTWEGHEYLDKIRDTTIWQKTKDKIQSAKKDQKLDKAKDKVEGNYDDQNLKFVLKPPKKEPELEESEQYQPIVNKIIVSK